jgi:hypothetical protein
VSSSTTHDAGVEVAHSGLVTYDDVRAELPVAYQLVLAYLDEGCTNADIAARLGVEEVAVDPLIELAKAKLERVGRAASDERQGGM